MSALLRVLSALLLLALWASGCTVKKSEPPAPAGPSEFATSISLTASPDTLNHDGASQSQIDIVVRDANSQPVRGLGMRVDMALNGIAQDFGRLSARSVTTGSDGRASVIYTAPPPISGFTQESLVSIQVTPVGTNASTQWARHVDIRLVPSGVIVPPGAEVPDFTITPDDPNVLDQVQFDASDPRLDGVITSYQWSFGDGSTGAGRIVTHQYRAAGDVVVTLTVTDVTGTRTSRSKALRVGEGVRPKADFTFSPALPAPGQDVFFNASGSTAGEARHIVRYEWDFGDGTRGTGVTSVRRFTAAGSYAVTLVVTDNAGLTASVNRLVKVEVPGP